jgi:hypothetical protein
MSAATKNPRRRVSIRGWQKKKKKNKKKKKKEQKERKLISHVDSAGESLPAQL